jgi:hypothetical protein
MVVEEEFRNIRRKYAKDYYQKHKGKELDRKKNRRVQLGQELLNQQRNWYQKAKALLKLEFPSECPLCGIKIENHSVFHEIKGKPHTQRLAYVKRNKKDFALLCSSIPCHAVAHWFLKLGYDWKETLNIVRKIKSRKI